MTQPISPEQSASNIPDATQTPIRTVFEDETTWLCVADIGKRLGHDIKSTARSMNHNKQLPIRFFAVNKADVGLFIQAKHLSMFLYEKDPILRYLSFSYVKEFREEVISAACAETPVSYLLQSIHPLLTQLHGYMMKTYQQILDEFLSHTLEIKQEDLDL